MGMQLSLDELFLLAGTLLISVNFFLQKPIRWRYHNENDVLYYSANFKNAE